MIRTAVSLCVVASLVASTAACGASKRNVSPEQVAAVSLCRAEYSLQSKLRIFRSDYSGRNLVAVGNARGVVFVARRKLSSLIGAEQIPQTKLEWCGQVSRDYLAISNKRVIRVRKSLCREVRTQRAAKRNKVVMIDSLVEPLKSEYRWHAEWYNEDSLRARARGNLPKEAKALKQVLRSC